MEPASNLLESWLSSLEMDWDPVDRIYHLFQGKICGESFPSAPHLATAAWSQADIRLPGLRADNSSRSRRHPVAAEKGCHPIHTSFHPVSFSLKCRLSKVEASVTFEFDPGRSL